jgi:hypothetical protein
VIINKQQFSTSLPTRALPPILIAAIKPVSRLLAVIVGRRFRTWWKSLPEETKLRFKEKSRKNGQFFGASGVFFLALIAYGYQSVHLRF